MTKNNRSIRTCSTASNTNEETNNSDQFVPTVIISAKKKSNTGNSG